MTEPVKPTPPKKPRLSAIHTTTSPATSSKRGSRTATIIERMFATIGPSYKPPSRRPNRQDSAGVLRPTPDVPGKDAHLVRVRLRARRASSPGAA